MSGRAGSAAPIGVRGMSPGPGQGTHMTGLRAIALFVAAALSGCMAGPPDADERGFTCDLIVRHVGGVGAASAYGVGADGNDRRDAEERVCRDEVSLGGPGTECRALCWEEGL